MSPKGLGKGAYALLAEYLTIPILIVEIQHMTLYRELSLYTNIKLRIITTCEYKSFTKLKDIKKGTHIMALSKHSTF
jgi:hypothetical protein